MSNHNTAVANTIATATDIYTARLVMDALKAAGWIVVRKGAIGEAQRDSYYEALEDVRMGLVRADNGNERQDSACRTLAA